MANRKVAIVRSIKLGDKWIYCSPAKTAGGRLSSDQVYLKTKLFRVPADTITRWYVTYYEGTKKIWKRIEDTHMPFTAAIAEKNRLEKELAFKSAGGLVATPEERTRLADAAHDFLEEVRLRRKSRDTSDLYSVTVSEFVKVCARVFVEDITHKDVLHYIDGLLKRGLTKHTANNRAVSLKSFLRFCSLDADALVQAKDKPKFELKKPEIYTNDEVNRILAACSKEYYALVFETLWKTGMRYQELANLEWREIDWESSTVHLHSKHAAGFQIKDREERVIPIETTLLGKLKTWRKTRRKSRLIFGTSNDTPPGKWNEALKVVVRKAGLNCGHCPTCKTKKECERFYLHKFRSTYMSRMLQGGMDLSTLMSITGHQDLKSVRRYLGAADNKAKQQKVNAVFGKKTHNAEKVKIVFQDLLTSNEGDAPA